MIIPDRLEDIVTKKANDPVQTVDDIIAEINGLEPPDPVDQQQTQAVATSQTPKFPTQEPTDWSNPQYTLRRLGEIFLGHYPEYRPSYADCQVLFACLYGISVRGSISGGQVKCLEAIIRRHKMRTGGDL